jgi:DNA polymerase III delta subunit
LLNKINNFWIKKVLESSLQNQFRIELGLEEQFDAIALPCQMAWETAEQHRRILPRGTRVIDKFDELGTGRTLLILGEPGSGKTTALLELARDLLMDAQSEVTLPIPVVLNLSSWGMNPRTKTLVQWLVEELDKQYQVPQIQGKTWVEQQKLLLLLDGLDEVKVTQRERCLKAINDFIQAQGCTEMVVCSRFHDYHDLSEKLRCQAAIYLQPLTPEHIHSYFEQAGSELANLKTLWQDDDTLQELATNPLMLNIMMIAYQGLSVTDLPQMNSLVERRRHLFDAYITRMFNRRGVSQIYSKERSLHWLTVLAQQMLQESQTIFLIERMQPSTWLKPDAQYLTYNVEVRLLVGFIGGLASSLHFSTQVTDESMKLLLLLLPGIVAGVAAGITSTIIPGLISGFVFVLIVLLIAEPSIRSEIVEFMELLSPVLIDGVILGLFLNLIPQEIRTVDTIRWSWRRSRKYALVGLACGIAYVSIRLGLTSRYYTTNGFHYIFIELFVFLLIAGLLGGLDKGNEIDKSSIPNQGIWRSAINTTILCAIGIPIGTMFGWIYARNQIEEAISIGLAVGLLAGLGGGQFSGLVLIQHFTLRVILWWNHYIPWNYARFLDYAVNFSSYPPSADSFNAAMNEILTPPMGTGSRLVLLPNFNLLATMNDSMLSQLERTLVNLPSTNHLLLTLQSKPDNRLKSTKLLMKYSQVKEFQLIPAWDTQKLIDRVRDAASFLSIPISAPAANLLALAVGNNTRLLFNELEKLSLVAIGEKIEVNHVKDLVSITTTSTLQLASAICASDAIATTRIFTTLVDQNEPVVKIIATLTTLFRTWLTVKAMVAEGETDNHAIATAAGVGNPNRVYYLKQEVAAISLSRLKQIMYQLLELEILAKQGGTESLFTSKIITLCTQ